MPCSKCNSDFNLLNWKYKCGECESRYCAKCMKKKEGILYCDKCMILLKRPPDRSKLMELRSRDLQNYLNKNNISTHGLVEKHELVELLCTSHIPVRPKRGVEKLIGNFGGSVPNLARPEAFVNNLRSNVESLINNHYPGSATGFFSETPSPTRDSTRVPPPRPPPPRNSSRPDEEPSTPPPPPPPPPAQESSNPPTPQHSASPTVPPGSPRIYPKLSDFGNAEDMSQLSSKQLKELLTLNRVDYKGCIERSELLERATRLWNDNEKKKAATTTDDIEDLCKLCMDAPLECVLLECGHMATCVDCGKKLNECPICRQYVTRIVRTFKA